MQYLRELCPNAEEISPGIYLGTCVETAFLLSYPKAKQEHPHSWIRIQSGRDHAILIADDTIYDPIATAIGIPIDYWTDSVTIEEADFSEWWTVNMLGCCYHPSVDFIAEIASNNEPVRDIERLLDRLHHIRLLNAETADEMELATLYQEEVAIKTAVNTLYGSSGVRSRKDR